MRDAIQQKQEELNVISMRIKELQNNAPKEIDEDEFRKLVHTTKQLIKNRNLEELRRFISFYVSRIEIGKDDITVVLSYTQIVSLLGGTRVDMDEHGSTWA